MTEYADTGQRRVILQVLSHTRTSILRDCAAKYGYRYVDELQPRVEDPTRIRGRGLHEGLRAGFEVWRSLKTMSSWGRNPHNDPGAPLEPLEVIRTAALAASHEANVEELAEARRNGAPVEQCDEVLAALTEAHEADLWALGHHFDVSVPRDFERKTPILVEHEFDVPLLDAGGRATHLRWIGVFDCVMFDSKMQILELHEHKSVGTNAGSDEHRRRIEGDPQTTSYVYALRVMQKRGELDGPLVAAGLVDLAGGPDSARARAVPIGSVVVNVIRRKKPSEPKLLADGTISADQRIDTLPEVYEAALGAQAEPPGLVEARAMIEEMQVELDTAIEAKAQAEPSKKTELELERAQKRLEKAIEALAKKRAAFESTRQKQLDLLDRLRQRGDTFLARHEQFVTDAEVERWRAEQWIEAERIRMIERRPAARTRNLGFCTSPGRGCMYRALCYSGGDAQIRAAEFTTPGEREILAAAAEEKADEKRNGTDFAPDWG